MCNTGIGIHTTDLQFKVDWRDGNRRLAWITADNKVEIIPDLTLDEAKRAMADMVVTLAGLVQEHNSITATWNADAGPYFDDSGTPGNLAGPPPTQKLHVYPYHDCKGTPGYPCEICGKTLPKLEVT